MKKILTISSLILIVIALSACTKTTTNSNNQTTVMASQEPADAMTKATTAPETATASFAPTTDEDIKAIDKTMDQVNFNDYSDKALDDLK